MRLRQRVIPLLCIAEQEVSESFYHVYEELRQYFDCELRIWSLELAEQIAKQPPKVVVTEAIGALSCPCPIFFCLGHDKVLQRFTVAVRRHLRTLAVDFFVANAALGRVFHQRTGIVAEHVDGAGRLQNLLAKISPHLPLVNVSAPPPPAAPLTPPKLERRLYQAPRADLVTTPDWFVAQEAVVSIVVPLFCSQDVIRSQIRTWDMTAQPAHEVIYVDDGCPYSSHAAVLNAWCSKRDLLLSDPNVHPDGFPYRIGKIVRLNWNSGFASACNEGAKQAQGEYLLFLHADTVVTLDWLRPLYERACQDSSIGVISNLQLHFDGTIASSGEEWHGQTFASIGRDVYQGKRLVRPFWQAEAPAELFEPVEREVATGCCFLIRRSLFDELGGFDIGYRIASWEGADLCLRARQRGYKVYYEPQSRIYHHGNHTNVGCHAFSLDNCKRFYEQWLDKLERQTL